MYSAGVVREHCMVFCMCDIHVSFILRVYKYKVCNVYVNENLS